MASQLTRQVVGNVLKEVRILLCPSGEASAATRAFVDESLSSLKKSLPQDTQILVRESRGAQPQIWARFDHGREQLFTVTGENSTAILEQIQHLAATGRFK